MSYALGAVGSWIDNIGVFPWRDTHDKIEVMLRDGTTRVVNFDDLVPVDFEIKNRLDDIISYRWKVYF